jgi:hypothetical protein
MAMKKVYITHCSAKKDNSFKGTGIKTTPDKLYTAQPLQRFIKKCREVGVKWAILSDKHGVVFPNDKIAWYDKHPGSVTDPEYQMLVANFVDKLSGFDKICFYHNPGRFHRLYKRLVVDGAKKGLKIILITHLAEIG